MTEPAPQVANCPDDLLPGYALGVLDPEELEVVEHHLARCARCRAVTAELRSTAQLLAFAPTPNRSPLALAVGSAPSFTCGSPPRASSLGCDVLPGSWRPPRPFSLPSSAGNFSSSSRSPSSVPSSLAKLTRSDAPWSSS